MKMLRRKSCVLEDKDIKYFNGEGERSIVSKAADTLKMIKD